MINDILSRSTVKPEVGMGATLLYATDRRAATIIEVGEKSIVVQRDGTGATYRFRMVAGRWYSKEGPRLCVGRREDYFDPSF